MLLTFLVFGRSVTFSFVDWDDLLIIANNKILNPVTVRGLASVWTQPRVQVWTGQFGAPNLYTPVTYTLWAIVAMVSQHVTPDGAGYVLDPGGFHALNVILHAGCAVMVFIVLRQLTSQDWPAAIGAAVFAVHPLQAEAVSWIAGMNNLLAGLFMLISIAAYLCHAGGRRRRLWYAVAIFAAMIAMLSKPTAVVLPPALFVIDWLMLRRPIKRVILCVAAFVLLTAPFVVIGRLAEPGVAVASPTVIQRGSVMIDTIGFYVWKIGWPHPLVFDYGRKLDEIIGRGPAVGCIGAMIVLASIGWLGVQMKHWPIVGAVLVFIVGVLPVSGITPFTFQYFSTVADRYVYFSMIGPAILVAILLRRFNSRGPLAVAIAGVLLLAGLCFAQSGTWANSRTLALHGLKYNPQSFAAFKMLAHDAREAHDDASAESYLRQAIAIAPDDPYCNVELARLLMTPCPAEAVDYFYRATQWGLTDSAVMYDLAVTCLKLGRPQESAAALAFLLKQDPGNATAHATLGYALAAQGQLDAAESELRQAIVLDPALPLARRGLQEVLAAKAASTSRP